MTPDEPTEVADEIVALRRPLLLVFDCDGVLAPIVDHPDQSHLLDGTTDLLADLASCDDVSVAILSGRALAGLEQFGFPPSIDVVGSYGNERRGRDAPALTDDERELLVRLASIAENGAAEAGDGAHVEHKPASVVLHVRTADSIRGAAALERTRATAEAIAGVDVHDGSAVVELMARSADKGTALDALRSEYRSAATVYLGDDVPDEDAFARLGSDDLSVRVGTGESRARRRLADPDAVRRMLRRLAESVSSPPDRDRTYEGDTVTETIIHRSPLPDVEIPEVTITEHVLRRADELSDRVAIRDAAGTSSFTFGELRTAIHSLAGGLQARGVAPGTVVGLMAPNTPAYAVIFHGVAVAGAAVTTINPTYGAEEVRHQLQDAGASMLFVVPMFLDVARAAVEGTGVTEIVVLGDAVEETTAMADLFGDPIDQVPVDLHDHTVVLPYSSGTTGLPKGVMLTHHNLVANIEQCQHAIKYTDGEVALAFLPFFHIYGMQVLMNGLLANGVTTVTMPRFDMVEALTAVQELKITRFFAVPPVILGLAKHPIVDQYDMSSVRQIFSGAAPLGAELAAEAGERLHCEVVQGFGMTELSPVSHCTVEGDYRPGTSGVTVSNTESRVVDPNTGEDQPVGERGELWVRGPQVMKGYLNNPDATAATVDDDGWLHTGDIAIIDEHHHMTIVDRLKELIKFKGFQVAPAELEALLITHPKVADVAVIGVPDDEAGEVPKAFVAAVEGETVTLDEIQTLVSEHLVSYKQIQQLEVVEAIPKSASGKILRKDLRTS